MSKSFEFDSFFWISQWFFPLVVERKSSEGEFESESLEESDACGGFFGFEAGRTFLGIEIWNEREKKKKLENNSKEGGEKRREEKSEKNRRERERERKRNYLI